MPLFASLTPEFIDSLRDRVELVRFAQGDVICRQGDVADAFYLVRLGFVKVSETYPGGELVLGYLARGGYFGEIGLLGRRRAHGHLHGARSRGGGADQRRRFRRAWSSSFPTSATVSSASRDERIGAESRSAWHAIERCPARPNS